MSNEPAFPADPSLSGRVVIITGGSRGLGRSMALTLARAGANVFITASRSPRQIDEVKYAANAEGTPGRVEGIRADVTDAVACERVVASCIDVFGGMHALVNNAGRGLREFSETYTSVPLKFWELDPDVWRRIIDTNVNGPFLMTRAVTPHLLNQSFGRIVNISTSDVTMVRRGYAPYGPSKSALEAMTRIWAQDLEATGVTVNALLPGGATDTDFIPGHGADRKGADGNLLPVTVMDAAILWLISDRSNGESGARYIGQLWDNSLPPEAAALRARQPHAERPAIM